jgi:hypothetical protein
MPSNPAARANSYGGTRGAATAPKVSTTKKKKASFPILPRADDDDDDLDSDATAELLEAGIQRKAALKDAPAHTHGRNKPKEVVVKGSGIQIANPRELPPADGYTVRTWIERRGGVCCNCCGGFICGAGTFTKLVIVRCCGACTLLIAAGAVVVLVWLQRRVDELRETMG